MNETDHRKTLVVGVVGRKRSGKDSFVRFCVEALRAEGYRPAVLRFALPLKNLVVTALGLPATAALEDEALKEDGTPVDLGTLHRVVTATQSYLRHHALPPLTAAETAAVLGLVGQPLGRAYRTLLQYIGTDVVRKRDPEHWVRATVRAVRAVREERDVVFVADVRFPNEALALQEEGAVLVRVVRRGYQHDPDPHPSETMVDAIAVDRTVEAGSLAELERAARAFVAEEVQLP